MKVLNSYLCLGDNFYQRSRPTVVEAPEMFLWNQALAEELALAESISADPRVRAQYFSGNRLLQGPEPIALAYAGHQFGHFVPQLGDGRAHLLGEVVDHEGKRWDIQLKGSGPTRFSRGGDGRCALGPAIREFIMSEAMHALGVATSRCLAVVKTGELVLRERPLSGAVVTRVAASHLRVGTFQYFAARQWYEDLRVLADYAINRHEPTIEAAGGERYILFLDRVIDRQIQLIVDWMRVGFIHGVMNTDNTTVSGETIDYGPCAMMGRYDPQTAFSSIDTQGRYAFGNQPTIGQWNMARLAECFIPLVDTDADQAIAKLEPLIADFPNRFRHAWLDMMSEKLGLKLTSSEDESILDAFLEKMKKEKLDYTLTFDRLTQAVTANELARQLQVELGDVFIRWQSRLHAQGLSLQEIQATMRKANPVIIPRNHHVEEVLRACQETGRTDPAEKFLRVLRSPYRCLPETALYQDPPADADINYRTFCGT